MEFNDGALKYRGYSWFSVGLSLNVDDFEDLNKLFYVYDYYWLLVCWLVQAFSSLAWLFLWLINIQLFIKLESTLEKDFRSGSVTIFAWKCRSWTKVLVEYFSIVSNVFLNFNKVVKLKLSGNSVSPVKYGSSWTCFPFCALWEPYLNLIGKK